MTLLCCFTNFWTIIKYLLPNFLVFEVFISAKCVHRMYLAYFLFSLSNKRILSFFIFQDFCLLFYTSWPKLLTYRKNLTTIVTRIIRRTSGYQKAHSLVRRVAGIIRRMRRLSESSTLRYLPIARRSTIKSYHITQLLRYSNNFYCIAMRRLYIVVSYAHHII